MMYVSSAENSSQHIVGSQIFAEWIIDRPETEVFYQRTAPWSSTKTKTRGLRVPIPSTVTSNAIGKNLEGTPGRRCKSSSRVTEIWADLGKTYTVQKASITWLQVSTPSVRVTPLHRLFNLRFKALQPGTHPWYLSFIPSLLTCVVSRAPPLLYLAQHILLYSPTENNFLLSSLCLPLPHPAALTIWKLLGWGSAPPTACVSYDQTWPCTGTPTLSPCGLHLLVWTHRVP